jgi:DHA1 family tetracycline resistance protein-like MFS transporter
MGMIGAMFGVGFIIGPMLGGILGEYGVRVPFYAAAIVALLNVAYGWLILPESLPADQRTIYSRKQLFAKSNPFTALLSLIRLPRTTTHGVSIPTLAIAVAMTHLAQSMMHTTFVLFTTLRYGWGPQDNGIALFIVGMIHAAVQGGLLSILVKRFGEKRLAIVAILIGAAEFAAFALAMNGTTMYAIILIAFLGSAAMPALMGLISKTLGGKEQGSVMGVFTGLSALMGVIAPLIATPIFAATNHYTKTDIRFGTVYLVAAILEVLSAFLVWRALRQLPLSTPLIE